MQMFETPEIKAPPPAPALPDPNKDILVAQQLNNAAQQQRLSKGRASTILTSPMGDTSQTQLASRTLLGM